MGSTDSSLRPLGTLRCILTISWFFGRREVNRIKNCTTLRKTVVVHLLLHEMLLTPNTILAFSRRSACLPTIWHRYPCIMHDAPQPSAKVRRPSRTRNPSERNQFTQQTERRNSKIDHLTRKKRMSEGGDKAEGVKI